MINYPSPGIYVNEIDKTVLTKTEPKIGPTTLVLGVFERGPVEELTPIKNLQELIDNFGYPDDRNKISWYQAKIALDYGGYPLVYRLFRDTATKPNRLVNAYNPSAYLSSFSNPIVKNKLDFNDKFDTLVSSLSNNRNIGLIAKNPGEWGNSIAVAVYLGRQIVKLLPSTHKFNLTGHTAEIGAQIQLKVDDGVNPVVWADARIVGQSDTQLFVNYSGTNPLDYDDVVAFRYTGQTAEYALSGGATTTRSVVQSITTSELLAKRKAGSNDNLVTTRIINYIERDSSPVSQLYEEVKYLVHRQVFEKNDSIVEVGTDNYYLVTESSPVSANVEVPYAKNSFGKPVFWSFLGVSSNSTTYYGKFNNKVGDAVSVAIIDVDGKYSGQIGKVLEVYTNLSTNFNATNQYNKNISFFEKLNNESKLVNTVFNNTIDHYVHFESWEQMINGVVLVNGRDFYVNDNDDGIVLDSNDDLNILKNSYYNLVIQDEYDIDYITPYINYRTMTKANSTEDTGYIDLTNYILENICEKNLKSILVVSPSFNNIVKNKNHISNSITFRNNLYESSFGYLIHEWIYQYDNYNKSFFWLPGAVEVIGVCLRNQFLSRNFLSPAGYVRGVLINGIKLSNTSSKADRDVLYQYQINSIISSQGQGFVLYGDKTLLTYDSLLNRINVRKTIIEIHKNCVEILKPYLFGVNNEYTRSQLTTEVTRYLRTVVNDNGISSFSVKCDQENNPQEVIDRNELVIDITIRPTTSINYITLNITADRNEQQVSLVQEFIQ